VKYPGADEAGFAGATGSLRRCPHGLRKIRPRRRLLRIRRFHDSPFRVRIPGRSIVRRRDIHRCGSTYPMKSRSLSKAALIIVSAGNVGANLCVRPSPGQTHRSAPTRFQHWSKRRSRPQRLYGLLSNILQHPDRYVAVPLNHPEHGRFFIEYTESRTSCYEL